MENSETNNSLGLNTLTSTGTSKNRKRVGRGIGSGAGKTAGRGHKAVSYTHLTLPTTD